MSRPRALPPLPLFRRSRARIRIVRRKSNHTPFRRPLLRHGNPAPRHGRRRLPSLRRTDRHGSPCFSARTGRPLSTTRPRRPAVQPGSLLSQEVRPRIRRDRLVPVRAPLPTSVASYYGYSRPSARRRIFLLQAVGRTIPRRSSFGGDRRTRRVRVLVLDRWSPLCRWPSPSQWSVTIGLLPLRTCTSYQR